MYLGAGHSNRVGVVLDESVLDAWKYNYTCVWRSLVEEEFTNNVGGACRGNGRGLLTDESYDEWCNVKRLYRTYLINTNLSTFGIEET